MNASSASACVSAFRFVGQDFILQPVLNRPLPLSSRIANGSSGDLTRRKGFHGNNPGQAAVTKTLAARRVRGLLRMMISTSWSSEVRNRINRSTEKPSSLYFERAE